MICGVPTFEELLNEMKRIHESKSADYGGADPLGNFQLAELAGVPPWIGILVRLTDKLSRACAFARRGHFKVKDEQLRDTLLDAANYALLCLMAFEEDRQRKQPFER